MNLNQLELQIFLANETNFNQLALEVFKFQAKEVAVYRNYLSLMRCEIDKIKTIEEIPYLPISLFKTNCILANEYQQNKDNLLFFESSGTTQTVSSKHYISNIEIYKTSFRNSFKLFFGEITNYCILGLLPSYLEKGNSSLVFMVDDLIKNSKHLKSGFYLHNHSELFEVLQELENRKQPTLLFGVTYALIDFANEFPLTLNSTQIIETGGMKGRKEEMSRTDVHQYLQKQFQLETVFSEYGMTELFSQAYSKGQGIFNTPPWFKLLQRELNDPLNISKKGRGALNCIDLANLNSCSFIATDDYGEIFDDSSFTVLGRIENSEIRGCSLLTI